ncbi:MAG TPA: HemK/PrmC family methyltransferase [Myxococcales bacterium]
MTTANELLGQAVARLADPAQLSEDPSTEARELLAHALGILPRQLRSNDEISPPAAAQFERLLARRLAAEPTGYIVGGVEILGLRFKVDRRGFIPRLDLPVLIEAGLSRLPEDAEGFALDLACGIGAAGICVAHRRPKLHVDLADLSAEAIELARENAAALIPGRASCYAGDLYGPLPHGRKYAIVTANPPWVPDGTDLPEEVLNEPQVSFFGGPDGLDLVRKIIAELPEWLAPKGVYAQECDPSQVPKVMALLEAAGLRETSAHADKEGVKRVVSARKPG